jgi:hypothetical protein
MAGRNLACLPTPDNGGYSVGLWLCANAYIGTGSGTDYLQITSSQVDSILDYAQHIACFKMAGVEFNETDRMRMNLIETAKTQNNRLDAISFYRSQLEQPAIKSDLQVPRLINA